VRARPSAKGLARRLAVAGGLIVVAAAGVIAGFAAAGTGSHPPSPAGVASVHGGATAAAHAPHYPKNAAGLTYGSLQEAHSADQAPALILVTDTKGENGYVFKTDLDAATGANIASPAQAAEWQAKQNAMAAAGQTTSIPVYQSDGVTRIGDFVISPSKSN
jgi:hypothetical protein